MLQKGTIMFKRRTRVGAAMLGSLAVAGLALSQTGPVHADPAPQAGDVVGVGSDIIQNSVNFLADGYRGLPGYNTAGNKNRIFNFDSVGDGNGRNAFVDPLLDPTTPALNATVVLRAGTSPVRRPNGGGKGISAFLADGNAANGGRIQFARTPNPLTADQANTASNTTGVGPVRTVQFAKDYQYIATAQTTNAPPGLTAKDLLKIYNGTYKTWGDVKDNDAATNGTAVHTGWDPSSTVKATQIVPLIPQDGAGVQTIFLNAIKAATGTALTLDTNASDGYAVKKVQQNDPSTITGPNEIVPFPQGRYKLLNDGYFYPPTADYNSNNLGTPQDASGIKLQVPNTAGVAASAYKADIPYYVLFRQSDLDKTGGWQPGSTLNWVKTFFANPAWDPDGGDDNTVPPPFVASPAGKAILNSLGLDPSYELKPVGFTVG